VDEIGEVIDSLQSISRFVESLYLDLDPGFLIGDVTMGFCNFYYPWEVESLKNMGQNVLVKLIIMCESFVVTVYRRWSKH
jgi:hypothetical protein